MLTQRQPRSPMADGDKPVKGESCLIKNPVSFVVTHDPECVICHYIRTLSAKQGTFPFVEEARLLCVRGTGAHQRYASSNALMASSLSENVTMTCHNPDWLRWPTTVMFLIDGK